MIHGERERERQKLDLSVPPVDNRRPNLGLLYGMGRVTRHSERMKVKTCNKRHFGPSGMPAFAQPGAEIDACVRT